MERLDDEPWAKGRQSLDLSFAYKIASWRFLAAGHGEIDAAWFHDRHRYDEPTFDAYAWLVEPREVWAAWSGASIDVTVGRQVVPWGTGEMISPLDAVNPRDEREPGSADIEDLRLPVLATRVAWFRGRHRVEAMVVHETHFGHRSPPLGPYSPFTAVFEDDGGGLDLRALVAGRDVAWDDRQGRFALDQQAAFLRWLWTGPGADLGLYAASLIDLRGVIELPPLAALASADRIDIPVDHRRYHLAGASGAHPWDDWIFRWELAADIHRLYNVGRPEEDPTDLRAERATLLTAMVGATWAAIEDTFLSLELSRGLYVDRPDDLLFEADAAVVAIRLDQQLDGGDVRISAAFVKLGLARPFGWLARGEISARLVDTLRASIGFITYQPGSELGPISGLDRHDRAQLGLRWDFASH